MSVYLPDFNKYKTRIDILDLVVEQIKKDLQLTRSITYSLPVETAFDSLCTQVQDILKEKLGEGENFKALFYQIDISEKKIAEYFASHQNVNELALYANLIVEREMQKVITRLYFSNKLEK
jgi:hypothetical protein